MRALRALLGTGAAQEGQLPVVEILKRTPLDQLEDAVRVLMERRPPAEVRRAMIDLLATAPPADFATVKAVFIAHCADARP